MAYLASDYEVTYQGDGTGNQLSNIDKPCVSLTESDYDSGGNISFNFGDIDAAAKTIGIRLKAKGSQPAGDFLWNPIPLTAETYVANAEVWIEAEAMYVEAYDAVDVTWKMGAVNNTQELVINVNHSATDTGQPTPYPWTLAADDPLLDATYRYTRAALEGDASIVFDILPGSGYTSPNTQARPSSVSIPVADYLPPISTGGYAPMQIPASAGIEYSDSPMVLTNAMKNGNGEIIIVGKRIKSEDTLVQPINFSQLTPPFKIIAEDNITQARGMHFFGDIVTDYEFEARNNIFFGMPAYFNQDDVKGYGTNALHLNCPKSTVIEHNHAEECGLAKVALNKGYIYERCLIQLNSGKNLNSINGHSNFIGLYGEGNNGGAIVPNAHIRYNRLINDPLKSRMEDTITIYQIKGTAANPVIIEHNLLDFAARGVPIDYFYSGQGIIADGFSDDIALANEYIYIQDNHLIRQANGCISLALARNSIVRGNRCVVSAKYADGTAYGAHTSGITTDDFSPSKNTSYNNQVYDNVVGVITVGGYNGTYNYNFNNNGGGVSYTNNNQNLPDPIDRALENMEITYFNNKLSSAGLVCGPRVAI